MRKLLLALAFTVAPTLAWGQCTGVFPPNTLCGNLGATPAPPSAFTSSGTIVGPGSSLLNGLPIWGNTSGTLLKDGNNQSIPGNYTFLSANAFSGTVAISGTANFGPSSFKVNNQTFTWPATGTTVGGLDTTQTWTGVNTLSNTVNVSGTAFFKTNARFGGSPWIDVKAGAQGCAAALGNGGTDDSAAIQCAVNYISNTYSGGGVVYFPQGNYRSNSTINVGGGVILQGASKDSTVLSTGNDIILLRFLSNASGGLRDMFVSGFQNSGATKSATVVDNGAVHMIFRDCFLWGGKFALEVGGNDSLYENCNFQGWNSTVGGNIYISNSSNWYIRNKIDSVLSVPFAVYMDGNGTLENGFIMTDFSGAWTDSAIWISAPNAYTTFESPTISGRVILRAHTYTAFVAAKFGSYVSTTSNSTAIVASKALAAISATGATCAANYGITC